jgi:hypothetical protein
MPQGIGTYGSKLGRPPKKPKNAREAAIRRGGRKTIVGKFMGKQMTGKASPHTDRDESPISRSMARAKKYRKLMKRIPAAMPRMKGKKKKG